VQAPFVTPTQSLADGIMSVVSERKNAMEIVSKTRIDVTAADALAQSKDALTAIEAADLPVDDGLPPAAPTGVIAAKDALTGLGRVEFDIPGVGDPDHVRRAQVRYRKVGETAWVTVEADLYTGSAPLDLSAVGITEPTENWQAQAQFIDFFGRVSGFAPSAPVTAVNQTYIPYLKADAIRSGTMRAETLTLADDAATSSPSSLTLLDTSFLRFRDAAGAKDTLKLSREGLSLSTISSVIQAPDVERGSKITPMGKTFSAIHIADATAQRGWSIRADGSSTQNGIVRIDACPFLGADASTNSAYLLLKGISGAPNTAEIGPSLKVAGDLSVTGGVSVGAESIDLSSLRAGDLPGRVRLQSGNFKGSAGNDIADIVPLASLRDGEFKASNWLGYGNFRGAAGNDIADIVPLASLRAGQLPGKVFFQLTNFRNASGSDIADIVPLASLRDGEFKASNWLGYGNFRGGAGNEIAEIVPLASLRAGELPGRVRLQTANFRNASGDTINNVVPSDSIIQLAVNKLWGGGTGQTIDARLLPNIDVDKLKNGALPTGVKVYRKSIQGLDGWVITDKTVGPAKITKVYQGQVEGKVPWSKVDVEGVVFSPRLNRAIEALRDDLKAYVNNNFSRKGHDHDARYAFKGHDHDLRYAFKNHGTHL
jgi:hypothetical protein